MNFAENPLATRLRGGEFCILVEYTPPAKSQPFDSSITLGKGLARQIANRPELSGLAISDRPMGEDTHDAFEIADILGEMSGKSLLMHIAGKDRELDDIREIIGVSSSNGINNFMAVTGNGTCEQSPASMHRGISKFPYVDSIEILDCCRHTANNASVGVAVNPYKHTPLDQYLQYLKLIRKINCGADFVVTQVGWDMKKLQELKWFLQMREVEIPIIARLALLSPPEIEGIQDGYLPGVDVPKFFASALQREARTTPSKCIEKQITYLALQTIGCKFLGYSGIQLRGITDETKLKSLLDTINDFEVSLPTYNDWLDAWHHQNELNTSSARQPYYVFRELLQPDILMYDSELCTATNCPWPDSAFMDRVNNLWHKLVFSQLAPERYPGFIQKLLFPGRVFDQQELTEIFYLLPNRCPKQLVLGPCGNGSPEGECEFGERLCFFRRVLSLAANKHELDRLEEEFHFNE